jgi:hypothetical protein
MEIDPDILLSPLINCTLPALCPVFRARVSLRRRPLIPGAAVATPHRSNRLDKNRMFASLWPAAIADPSNWRGPETLAILQMGIDWCDAILVWRFS